jgi:hypothetical protein
MQLLIRDTFGPLEKNNIPPWAFFNLGKPFQVKKFDGSKITSEGFEFSGKLTSGDKIQKVIVDTGRSISIIITIIQTFYNPKSNTR